MLDFSKPIVIRFAGLDEKTAALVRAPGALERAQNVEFDKTGQLNKRRGYAFVDVADAINVFDDDEVFHALATYRDELVLFSYDRVVGLASRTASLRGAEAFVYRGPSNRGALRVQFVSSSRTSTQTIGLAP